jgi:hypothetical protein
MRPSRSMLPVRRYGRRLILVVALVAAAGACVADLTGIQEFIGGQLTGISLYPTEGAVVQTGDTVRLTAMGNVSGILGMLGYDPLPDAVWSVADSRVARLDPVPPPPVDSFPMARVRVLGLRLGETRVAVSARGFSAETQVRVIPAGATP